MRRDLNPGPFEYEASVILAYYARNETKVGVYYVKSMPFKISLFITP